MKSAQRYCFKVKEVMQLLNTGKPANLTVCTRDKNRPEKSGRRLLLRKVILSSYEGYGLANVRLQNGEKQSIHPVLIEKYNNTRVTP